MKMVRYCLEWQLPEKWGRRRFSYPTAGTSLWSRRRLQSASIRPSAVIVAATSGSATRPGPPVHGGPRDKRRQRKRSFFRQRRGEPALGRPLKPRTYQPQNDPTSVVRSIDRWRLTWLDSERIRDDLWIDVLRRPT